jgi:hypothetical protein
MPDREAEILRRSRALAEVRALLREIDRGVEHLVYVPALHALRGRVQGQARRAVSLLSTLAPAPPPSAPGVDAGYEERPDPVTGEPLYRPAAPAPDNDIERVDWDFRAPSPAPVRSGSIKVCLVPAPARSAEPGSAVARVVACAAEVEVITDAEEQAALAEIAALRAKLAETQSVLGAVIVERDAVQATLSQVDAQLAAAESRAHVAAEAMREECAAIVRTAPVKWNTRHDPQDHEDRVRQRLAALVEELPLPASPPPARNKEIPMRLEIRCSQVQIRPSDTSGVIVEAEVCDAEALRDQVLREPDDDADDWPLAKRYGEVQERLRVAEARARQLERDLAIAHRALAEAGKRFSSGDMEGTRLLLCDTNAQANAAALPTAPEPGLPSAWVREVDAAIEQGRRDLAAVQRSRGARVFQAAPEPGLAEAARDVVTALRQVLGWRELRNSNDDIPIERIEEIASTALRNYDAALASSDPARGAEGK